MTFFYFLCFHISNNISRDITLPDFLRCSVNYIAHFGTSRGLFHIPTQPLCCRVITVIIARVNPRHRRNRGGGNVELGFLYYSRSTREIIPSKLLFGNRISESRLASVRDKNYRRTACNVRLTRKKSRQHPIYL